MIRIRTLNNGIRLAMEEIPYVQSIALGIMVRTGSVNENALNSGISHVIEHMMFKGTEKRTAKELAEDVDRIGGQSNAFTGKEATCYYIKALKENADKAAEILIDMLCNSKFDPAELEREKKVILEEMKMIEDTPDDDIHDLLNELVFRGDNLGRNIIGTEESLARIDRNAILEYIKEQYTRDNIVIGVSGNFDEDYIVSLFEGKLDKFEEKKVLPKLYEHEYEKRSVIKKKKLEQSHICLGIRGISLASEDYYALLILSNIFGGSMSSRLFQSIREQKGLAYSVFSYLNAYSDTGIFAIYAGVAHEKVENALEGIKEELLKLKTEGVTEDEFNMAKTQLKSSYTFSQENVSGRMFGNAKNVAILGKVFTAEETLAEINQVSMNDINRMIDLVYDYDKYSVAIITKE